MLRKKTKEDWTEKRRNVARKLVLEGGWVQKKLFDFGWSDESECQACHEEEGTEKHRLYRCQNGTRSDGRFQGIQKVGTKNENFKKRSGSGKEVLSRILSVRTNGTGVTSSMKKCESEKHKS